MLGGYVEPSPERPEPHGSPKVLLRGRAAHRVDRLLDLHVVEVGATSTFSDILDIDILDILDILDIFGTLYTLAN